MKTYGRFAILIALFRLFSPIGFAQLPVPSIDPVQTEMQRVTIYGYQSQSEVAGAPYSAVEESMYFQRQPDGTYEDRSLNTTYIYRDSQGRTRAERYVTSEITGDRKPSLKSIFITDPAAGVLYRLEPQNRGYYREPWDANSRTLSSEANTTEQAATAEAPQSRATSESLGTSTLEGLTVEGTRQTLTVPAGAHGNDRPINIVVETWISPELKVAVLSKRDNSATGMRTTRLTKIDRSEPDPALFQPPSGYTFEEAPTHGGISNGPAVSGTEH